MNINQYYNSIPTNQNSPSILIHQIRSFAPAITVYIIPPGTCTGAGGSRSIKRRGGVNLKNSFVKRNWVSKTDVRQGFAYFSVLF